MKKIIFILFFLSFQTFLAQIKFDADFESGNLKSVTTSDSVEFNVETNEDIQGRWFYFRISGVKDKFIKVNITTAPHDFTRAMYSYNNKDYLRFSEDESPKLGTFQKVFEEDTVYVSYFTPYTYSMLQKKLISWKKNQFLKLDTLGFSPNLFPIQEMIITDTTVPSEAKQTIWIHARTHPGETPCSYHFDGIVNELLSNNEVIDYYLTKLEFHLIPFVNPDGVYFGNSRTNPNYIDLEREWDKGNKSSQEVQILRARLKELCDEKPVSVFLNLHSQASSHCLFWVHTANSTSQYFYTKELQFSNLNISDNNYFLKEDIGESNLRSYFPEGWLWNNYGDQVMALTYETPYNNYFRNNSEPYIEVTTENLGEIGRRTVYAIAEYLEISHPYHYIMDNKIAQFEGDPHATYDVTTEYFGEDFDVLAPDKNSQAIFESEELPSGIYDVSAWWVTNEANSYETEFEIITSDSSYKVVKTQRANGGQWNYLTSITLKEKGLISVKLKSNSTGMVIVDAFRFIHSGNITDVKDEHLPTEFVLYQNYPNPFNPSTTIKYSISNITSNIGSSKKVSLIVFDILGRKVQTLVNEFQPPGEYEVIFNTSYLNSKIASGPYFYRLQIGNNFQTKKMIFMK